MTTLQNVPEYTSSHTSFVLDLSPSKIWQKMQGFLDRENKDNSDSQSIHFISDHKNSEIYGLTFSDGKTANRWRVSLFLCQGPYNQMGRQGILVEFSCLRGCTMQFHRFYRKFHSELNSSYSHGIEWTPPLLTMYHQKPTTDVNYLKSLLAMAESGYCQCKTEALTALSSASSSIPNRDFLEMQTIWPRVQTILTDALESGDEELIHSAVMIWKNLSKKRQASLSPAIEACLNDIRLAEVEDPHIRLYHRLIREKIRSTPQ